MLGAAGFGKEMARMRGICKAALRAALRAALGAAALALAGAAAAEGALPAFHEVVDVAPDDALNVRTAPDAGAPVIGRLAPDRTHVEVTARRGGWGRVNHGERAGWVSMAFLERSAGQDGLPWLPALACFGTEPFWGLSLPRTDAFELDLGDRTVPFDYASRGRSENDPRSFGFTGQGPGGPAAGVVRREDCSDGMSDRLFGLRVELIHAVEGNAGGGGATRHLTGCCRLARD